MGLGWRGPDVAASFTAQLEDPRQLVAVAFLAAPGGAAAGYGTCSLLQLASGEPLGSIDELYVEPQQRRQGAGRALARLLVDWCWAQGASGVDAKALPGDRAVKSFFEGEGFTARLLVMHRRVSPSPNA